MAKTLINGVNEVLKKVQVVTTTNLLTSLTHSGKQVFIDQAVQCWNESIDQLYYLSNQSKPNQMVEESLTLVANQREYDLGDEIVRLHWPLHDETNGWFVDEFPGGYESLRKSQVVPGNYTGLPQYGVIRPDTGELYFDRIPTSDDAGRVFSYIYDKDLELALAADEFPFNNTVFRAMVPAVAELYKAYQENRVSEAIRSSSFYRAARLLSETTESDSWLSRRSGIGFDPFA